MSSVYSSLFIWSPIMLRTLLRLRRARMGERFGLYPRPHIDTSVSTVPRRSGHEDATAEAQRRHSKSSENKTITKDDERVSEQRSRGNSISG